MNKIILFATLVFTCLSAHCQPTTISQTKSALAKTTEPEQQVNLLCELSKLYWTSNADSAFAYARQAATLATKHHNQPGLAKAYNNWGAAYFMQGSYDKATTYYFKSLRIREEIGDSAGLAVSYNNVGNVYNAQENHGKALELYKHSLAIAQSINDTVALSRAMNNVGNALERWGKPLEAEPYYLQAFKLKEKINDKQGMLVCLNNLGYINSATGKWQEAIPYHEQALKLDRELDNQMDMIYSFRGLAEAYAAGKVYEKAIPAALQSLKVAQQLNSKDELRQSADVLNHLYTETGDFKKAHRYLTLYSQYSDSIQSHEVRHQLTEQQLKFEAEKKIHENKILQVAHDLQVRKLAQKRTVLYFTGALLLLFCTLTFVFFAGKQELRAVNNELTQRNQEINLRKEALLEQATLLQEQKVELEHLNSIKDKLFSIVAHDLRAPLVSLKSLLRLHNEGRLPEEKKNTFFKRLESEQQNALWLLESLLVWAKTQMQGLEVQPTSVKVQQVAQENLELLLPQAQNKNVLLQNQVPAGAVAFADTEMVKLVIRNLVSNAIKFCRHGDSVTLSAKESGRLLTVSVSDTGVGIAPEHLHKLFDNSNYSSLGTANEKGSGLGLQLCKDFIHKNNGTIWAESEPNSGSSFCFTLPLAPAPESAPASTAPEAQQV